MKGRIVLAAAGAGMVGLMGMAGPASASTTQISSARQCLSNIDDAYGYNEMAMNGASYGEAIKLNTATQKSVSRAQSACRGVGDHADDIATNLYGAKMYAGLAKESNADKNRPEAVHSETRVKAYLQVAEDIVRS